MIKYNLSIWSDYFKELSLEEAIELFIEFGFQHSEISINHTNTLLSRSNNIEKTGEAVCKFAAQRDFHITQGHLSFKKGLIDPTSIDDLKKELDLFNAIGVQNAVVHFNGGADLDPETRFQLRLEAMNKLVEYIKGRPIKLCLENLGSVPETHTVERIRKIMDVIGSDQVGICLDMGHLHLVNKREEATQTQTEFILGAGKDLCALHVTNNSGGGDDHLMPYSSRYGIDFKEVITALNKVDYSGLFNLEILGENVAPMYIRKEKLRFIKKMTDYMLTEEFLNS